MAAQKKLKPSKSPKRKKKLVLDEEDRRDIEARLRAFEADPSRRVPIEEYAAKHGIDLSPKRRAKKATKRVARR